MSQSPKRIWNEVKFFSKALITDRPAVKARAVRLYQLNWRKYKLTQYLNKSFANVYLSHIFGRKIMLAWGENTEKFDLVLGHDQFTLPAAYKWSRHNDALLMADIVEITTLKERSGAAIRNVPWIGRATMQLLTRRHLLGCSAVFTVSNSLKSYFSRLYMTNKVHLLRNLRRTEDGQVKVKDVRKEIGLPKNSMLIGIINSIAPLYGVELTIKSLIHLPDNYHIVMIGKFANENYRNELEDLIAENDLQSRVHYLGMYKSEEFMSRLKSFDCGINLLNPFVKNIEYSFPNRLTDLITACVPILSWKIQDAKMVVDDYKIGKCIATEDPAVVAKSVLELTDVEYSKELKKNLERCRAELNWENEAAVFQEVLDKKFSRWKKNRPDRKGPFRACILARKPIKNNSRINRFVRHLSSQGFIVTVVAMDKPKETSEYAEYYSIDDLKLLPERP